MTDTSINKFPLCKISMCDPPEETNLDELLNTTPAFDDFSSLYFVVEFNSSKTSILVKENQTIKVDDIICYMNDIPVKSKMNGRITEVTNKYIIGEYILDVDDNLEDQIKAQYGL